ncbi:MAG: dihydroorotase [Dehalococcoidia bacterium]|nr:dihydroorotase [Dehalococcoidia bacterium]
MKDRSLFVTGGRIIDPSRGIDMVGDLLIREGRLEWVGENGLSMCPDGCRIISAKGLVVSPGFIDLHCHLREPGFEEKETIATGTEAAARGGFTAVCCMPNTSPPIDSPESVTFLKNKAKLAAKVWVFPIGCVSQGRRGEKLTDMASLAESGVVGFSDDGGPVANPELMQRALERSRLLDLPVIDHCEDLALTAGGVMNEGPSAADLHLKGIPAAAEESVVKRDIELAMLTGARIHIAHVSTAGSVEIIRRGKETGVRVTAEATPHHLTLTDESVSLCGTNAKVNPPLRTARDVEALAQALKDGVIDAVATDHAPHTLGDKAGDFNSAAFGISGLETALPVVLTLAHEGKLELSTLIARLTSGPAKVLSRVAGMSILSGYPVPEGLGLLQVGSPGNLVLFDPDFAWVVDPGRFASKGRNNPWAGRLLRGKVMATVVGGEVVYRDDSLKIREK